MNIEMIVDTIGSATPPHGLYAIERREEGYLLRLLENANYVDVFICETVQEAVFYGNAYAATIKRGEVK